MSNDPEIEKLRQDMQSELQALEHRYLMSPRERKIKLITWGIRQAFLVALYVWFWEVTWWRYTLFLTIPLAIFHLAQILWAERIFKKRVERTKERIEALNVSLEDSEIS
ncbi:hypothetical protein [Robertkochia aurantiaca]|uniref:hypothetical protein n=1 Tax=Robertkochia aurantiaca TaxID=2873700 RepID=UPI001CCCF7DA|nr:hypothetical protein [Robertkochia sp. 3YJGBD-33]